MFGVKLCDMTTWIFKQLCVSVFLLLSYFLLVSCRENKRVKQLRAKQPEQHEAENTVLISASCPTYPTCYNLSARRPPRGEKQKRSRRLISHPWHDKWKTLHNLSLRRCLQQDVYSFQFINISHWGWHHGKQFDLIGRWGDKQSIYNAASCHCGECADTPGCQHTVDGWPRGTYSRFTPADRAQVKGHEVSSSVQNNW